MRTTQAKTWREFQAGSSVVSDQMLLTFPIWVTSITITSVTIYHGGIAVGSLE